MNAIVPSSFIVGRDDLIDVSLKFPSNSRHLLLFPFQHLSKHGAIPLVPTPC